MINTVPHAYLAEEVEKGAKGQKRANIPWPNACCLVLEDQRDGDVHGGPGKHHGAVAHVQAEQQEDLLSRKAFPWRPVTGSDASRWRPLPGVEGHGCRCEGGKGYARVRVGEVEDVLFRTRPYKPHSI